MIEHELHLDRKHIEILPYILTQSLDLFESSSIFLCCHDNLFTLNGMKSIVDVHYIFILEPVMIGECQWRNLFHMRFHVNNHLLGRGDTCKQHNVFVGQFALVKQWLFCCKEGLEFVVFYRCKE